jgi:hypothetical protein
MKKMEAVLLSEVGVKKEVTIMVLVVPVALRIDMDA